MREIIFDTETTGFDPRSGDRLVEIGCVELVDRRETGVTFHAYFNPERDMPAAAEAVHGLSIQFLSDKPLFASRVDELLEFLGDAPLIAHNAAFDFGFVNAELARAGRGLPARVIPLEVHHVASVGIDLWLAALAWGASGVAVLATGDEAPEYHEALRFQMSIAQAIADGMGYQGEHFRLIDARAGDVDRALWEWPVALPPRVAATFAATSDKRRTLASAFDHLALHAPVPRRTIALAAGAPFGTLAIDRDRCTMCLACVGSCPEAALLDNPETPQLRFIESNCVQCGLCASTCPEHAIALVPRLDLTPEARSPRVLNEAEMVGCTTCGKPLGTRRMIDGMLARLSQHSMFARPGALDRLRMCADCRVKAMVVDEPGGLDILKGDRI